MSQTYLQLVDMTVDSCHLDGALLPLVFSVGVVARATPPLSHILLLITCCLRIHLLRSFTGICTRYYYLSFLKFLKQSKRFTYNRVWLILVQATQHGFVGINIYAPWFVPKTNAKEDVIATQRAIDFYIGW